MTIRHQSSSALQALSGTDRSLRLAGALALQARTGGWLQVQCGQVWITRSGDGLDHVLSAGQRLRLSRGERVVAEPWQAGQAARLAWGAGAAGPQGAANSTNFPRAIETVVEWATELFRYVTDHGYTRVDVDPDAEAEWAEHVKDLYAPLLLRNARSWFTGYNSNVEGHDKIRYLMYNGGAPRYRERLAEVVANGYTGFRFS